MAYSCFGIHTDSLIAESKYTHVHVLNTWQTGSELHNITTMNSQPGKWGKMVIYLDNTKE
jgi:hypothetical protein